jgi:hypothetical protein
MRAKLTLAISYRSRARLILSANCRARCVMDAKSPVFENGGQDQASHRSHGSLRLRLRQHGRLIGTTTQYPAGTQLPERLYLRRGIEPRVADRARQFDEHVSIRRPEPADNADQLADPAVRLWFPTTNWCLFVDMGDKQEQNYPVASSHALGNWRSATDTFLCKGSYQSPPAPLSRLAKERCRHKRSTFAALSQS